MPNLNSVFRRAPLSRFRCAPAIALVLLGSSHLWAAFQSAPIVLVFPPGARATGLGEAFVGLADDANATFYNPAGLGQKPLANAWRSHLADQGTPFIAVAAKKKKEFSLREEIWVATAQGLLRYNGKAWDRSETHFIAQDENLEGILKKQLDTDDSVVISRAAQAVREVNNIEMRRFRDLRALFVGIQPDPVKAGERASRVLDFTGLDRDSATILGYVRTFTDSARAPGVTQKVMKILATPDQEFSKLVDVKIPFSIAVSDTITGLAIDGSDGLWIATRRGVWHFEGSSWTHSTILDGLPSDYITCLAVGPKDEIAAGTDAGCAIYADGAWKTHAFPAKENEDSLITSITFGKPGSLFAGTSHGLYRMQDSAWTRFDTANGLISDSVSALLFDSQNRLWIGGPNGVVFYDETSWKRYKFPQSVVYTFAELNQNSIWIGTNKGAIVYSSGRVRVDEKGKKTQAPPNWKVFHSKNSPVGNQVRDIAIHGKDVWLATDKGMSAYDHAEREVLLFWELLLPAMKLKDLYHLYGSFVFPTEDWGTLGFAVNYLNYGEIELTDEEGRVTNNFTSWDLVLGLSYALAIKQDFSFGLSIKYVHSALVPTDDETRGVGQTFAVDAALLRRNLLTRGLDLGLHLQNIGPPIFYQDPNNRDPLPFTVKLGGAYRAVETPVHDLNILLDLSRELAGNDYEHPVKGFWDGIYYDLRMDSASQTGGEKLSSELSEVQVNAGIEYWYVNFIAARLGYLFDWVGQRYELTIGIGLKYGNLNFDFSYIHSPEGFMSSIFRNVISDKDDPHREGSYGVRHGQPRFSLIFRF